MRAARIRTGAGLESIRLEDDPEPRSPGRGEALVRVLAATLNYRDIVVAKGMLPRIASEDTDLVPLSCATAEVIEVGEGVTRVKPSDRVNPLFGQGWFDGSTPPDSSRRLGGTTDGVARDLAVFDAESLVLVPDELSDLEAAALPCAGLTAWNALFGVRPIMPGEWILAQGTGGVSVAALQWAKAAGANVAITSSSDSKMRRAAALGADVVVNYRDSPDWPKEVERQTGGVEKVIDVVGADGLERAAALLNDGGTVAAIGMLASRFSWSRSEIDGKRIVPVTIGNRGQHEDMIALAAAKGIRPAVDAVFPLERLEDAYRRLEIGTFFGKVAITMA